jgi:hypothetical protein
VTPVRKLPLTVLTFLVSVAAVYGKAKYGFFGGK